MIQCAKISFRKKADRKEKDRMIVKIKNDKESWSYFECEIVHVGYKTMKNIPDVGNCVCIIENKEASADTVFKRISLETEKSHLRTIITDKVCYLLNNQGKTIDRI